jgi:hypothetical protein
MTKSPATTIRLAAGAALAATLMLLAANAGADTSSAKFIPADCQIVFHVDVERIAADPVFAHWIELANAPLRAEGSPDDIGTYGSVSVAFSIPTGFSILAPGRAGVEQPSLYICVTGKAPLTALEAGLVHDGFTTSQENGRTIYQAPRGGLVLTLSDDKKTALYSTSTANLDRMVAAFSGANATTIPGFGSGANSGTLIYVFGTGMGSILAQFAPLIGMGLVQAPQTAEQREIAGAMQQDVSFIGRVHAMELALSIDGENAEVRFRVATDTNEAAAGVARFIGNLLRFAQALAPTAQGLPTTAPRAEGNTISLGATQEKRRMKDMLEAILARMRGRSGAPSGQPAG